MKENPAISVIVPVYNVEKYLHRCIDSILTQTFTDFELLLIDDGSKDESGVICDEYAKKDLRVRVYHKENGGVSSARNLGIEQAKGEWIAFIDADDYIDDKFLEIEPGNLMSDVIQKPYKILAPQGNIIKSQQVKETTIQGLDNVFRFFVNKRSNALWDKIISRKIIGDRRFNTNVKIGEDFLFFLSILPFIQVYAFSGLGNYIYVQRDNSAMTTVNQDIPKRINIMVDNIHNIKNLTQGRQLYYLQTGIIYFSYLTTLIQYSKELNLQNNRFVSQLVDDLTWDKLKYLDLKKKVITYSKIFLYKLRK